MENITRKIFQQFKDCADILKANGFANAEGTRILFEADEKVFGTKIGADIANLKEDDIEEVEPNEVDLAMLKEVEENSDCHEFISQEEAMKELGL